MRAPLPASMCTPVRITLLEAECVEIIIIIIIIATIPSLIKSFISKLLNCDIIHQPQWVQSWLYHTHQNTYDQNLYFQFLNLKSFTELTDLSHTYLSKSFSLSENIRQLITNQTFLLHSFTLLLKPIVFSRTVNHQDFPPPPQLEKHSKEQKWSCSCITLQLSFCFPV